MTDEPLSGAELLRDVRGRKRDGVAHICMKPGLVDDWERAHDALVESETEDRSKPRLGSGGVSAATKKLAENVSEIEQQIEESDTAFRFVSIGKDRYAEICDENPPREKNMLDFTVGYNREAVNSQTVFECLVDPVFDRCEKKGCKHQDCGTWEQMLLLLNPSEWGELVRITQEVNGVVTGAPKSQLASRILGRRGAGSRQRAVSE